MDIIAGVMSKKNEEAYKLLLQLEARSAETPELYGYFEEMANVQYEYILKNITLEDIHD